MTSAILLLAYLAGMPQSTSGGALQLEQAVYDVQSYHVAIKVDPKSKTLFGHTVMDAKIVIPTASILLDLDDPYTVSRVSDGDNPLRFERFGEKIRVFFPISKMPGDSIRVATVYEGKPHVARNAPWDGGIVWAKTPSGADWISVALQGDGADMIFPCKDHPSDRPDQATMALIVPESLVAVGPGNLFEKQVLGDGTVSYTWHMPLPINNYSIVFNAAPYELVEDTAKSITGEDIPIHFYVLPESKQHAAKLIEEQKKYLAFMEKYCGPFPFRAVKAWHRRDPTPWHGALHRDRLRQQVPV